MAILVGVAFAALGGFDGCTISLADVGDSTGAPMWKTAFGALVGLAVGVVLVSRSLRHRPRRLWIVYGLGWILAAGLCAHTSERIMISRRRVAASTPIRFDRTNTASVSFTADTSDTYQVSIALKRAIPFEDLNAFVGGWQSPDKPLRKSPPRPELTWNLTGARVEERWSPWRDVYYASDRVGAGLGTFRAIEGEHYVVTATITRPSPTMQVLDPELQVDLGAANWTHVNVQAILAMYGAFIAGGIGFGILVVPALSRGFRRDH